MPNDLLYNLLNPNRLTAVVDVGANPIDDPPPYRAMLENGLCSVIAFEPQEDALQRLNDRKSNLETYLPYAVGDGKRATLRITQMSGLTSVFEPDPIVLKHFFSFSEWGTVVREVETETRRLDDIAEIKHLDFLKIDIQGGELAVFKNGREKLKSTVAVQTEVSFAKLYKDQPTFGDLDDELRQQGFIPHYFASFNKRLIAPLTSDYLYAAMNHLLEADAIYVRDFMRPDTLSSEQLKQLAMISHHAFRSFDLAMNCVFHLASRKVLEPSATSRYSAIIQKTR